MRNWESAPGWLALGRLSGGMGQCGVTEAEGVFPATTSRRISSSVRLLPGTRFEGSSFNRPCPHDDPLGAARSLGQREGGLTSRDADLGSKHHDAQTR